LSRTLKLVVDFTNKSYGVLSVILRDLSAIDSSYGKSMLASPDLPSYREQQILPWKRPKRSITVVLMGTREAS
jgi:hypothetical protein